MEKFDVLPLEQKEQFDIFFESLEKNIERPDKKDKKEAFIKSSIQFVSKMEREEEKDLKLKSIFIFHYSLNPVNQVMIKTN